MIDPADILIISNSQYADSVEVAEYYMEKRGIGHHISLNLGTSSIIGRDIDQITRAEFTTLTAALPQYYIDNGIQGVILSVCCPLHFHWYALSDENVYGYTYSLCIAFADMIRLNPLGFSGVVPQYCYGLAVEGNWKINRRFTGASGSHYISPSNIQDGVPLRRFRKGQTDSFLLPHGRLGYWTSISGGSGADKATAIQNIDDALWWEENGDPANEPVVLGYYHRVSLYMQDWQVELAKREMEGKVGRFHAYLGQFNGYYKYDRMNQGWPDPMTAVADLNVDGWDAREDGIEWSDTYEYYSGQYALGKDNDDFGRQWRCTLQAEDATGTRIEAGDEPVWVDADATTVYANNPLATQQAAFESEQPRDNCPMKFLRGYWNPPLDVWGWVGYGFINNGDRYLPSVNFKKGSWMYEGTSSGVSKYSLKNGACSACVPIREPLANGIPEIWALTQGLVQGAPMMMANIHAVTNSAGAGPYCSVYIRQAEVWGDPLHKPFPNPHLRKKGVENDTGEIE